MFTVFLILLVTATILCFIGTLYKQDGLSILGVVVAIISGITLYQVIGDAGFNPYMWGTFLCIVTFGVSAGVGSSLAENIKKRKKRK